MSAKVDANSKKMKPKFISAIVAILIAGFTFTTCNKSSDGGGDNGDNSGGNNVTTGTKVITSITDNRDTGWGPWTYTFNYDSQNRVVGIVVKNLRVSNNNYTYTFTYNDDVINEHRANSSSSSNYSYQLSDGRITSGDYTCNYDGNGNLTTATDGASPYHTYNYIWNGGNIVSVSVNNPPENDKYAIQPSNISNAPYSIDLSRFLLEMDVQTVMVDKSLVFCFNGYSGNRQAKLPASIKSSDSDPGDGGTWKLTYETNSDGSISKIGSVCYFPDGSVNPDYGAGDVEITYK